MRKAFVYRLYPHKTQLEKLECLLETARNLYNAALQERRDAWKMQRKSINYYDQANELKELRQLLPEVAQLNHDATQNILRRLDRSFKDFFRRIKKGQKPGFPRFKGYDRFTSITFPLYNNGIRIKDNRLYIQNIGLVKMKIHRPLEGVVKTVTIKRICEKWYVIFSNVVEFEPLPVSNKQVGIDVGLESFAVTSDGELIENPHYLKVSRSRLRVVQRKVSRRKKESSNRLKAAKLLARQHLKVKNQRRNFLHHQTHTIVKRYGYIAVEDLQIPNMLLNHHWAECINDASWGMFLSMLSYKAEWAGRIFTKVNPNGTSQTCSVCGITVPKNLSIRIHNCPYCGVSIHRDLNAALNILALGRSVWDITCRNTECVSQEAVTIIC